MVRVIVVVRCTANTPASPYGHWLSHTHLTAQSQPFRTGCASHSRRAQHSRGCQVPVRCRPLLRISDQRQTLLDLAVRRALPRLLLSYVFQINGKLVLVLHSAVLVPATTLTRACKTLFWWRLRVWLRFATFAGVSTVSAFVLWLPARAVQSQPSSFVAHATQTCQMRASTPFKLSFLTGPSMH